MKIKRSATVSLKFATEEKKQQIESLASEYQSVTQQYIDLIWEDSSLELNKETKALVKDTSLSSRFRSTTLNKGKRIWIPFKRTKVLNKWLKRGFELVHSVRLRKYNNNWYADLILEKEVVSRETGQSLGIDSGINKALSLSDGSHLGLNYRYYADKINRKQRKSKAYERALKERDNYLRQEINKIEFSSLSHLFVENIKGIQQKTKQTKRVNKTVRKLFSVWVQGKTFGWLKNKCEENCVAFTSVPARYTSQTCSQCGHQEKSNRTKELFKCKQCSFTTDADYNASLNILSVGLRSLQSLS